MKTRVIKRLGMESLFARVRTEPGKPLTLNHRRIFIIPTLRGFGFAGLILLLALIAFVYNNNLAYMLAFLLGSVFFITILHTYKTLDGLTVQEGHATSVFAGEAAGFNVIITNPKPYERQHLQLKINSVEHFSLKSHDKIQVMLFDLTQRRGWHPAGTVTLLSTYPLGLFRAWSPIRFSAKAMVYPKPSLAEIPIPEVGIADNKQGVSKKTGDEFYGLQSYQAGDPIRHIHWKTYAKGLGLYSKQYGGERSAEIWLNFSQTPGYLVEERLSQLCRWVLDAEATGLRYGFILPGTHLEPAQGLGHYEQCLEALALFNL